MATTIDVRIACDDFDSPDAETIRDWVRTALAMASPGKAGKFEVSVNVVDADEMQALNRRFRDQDKPTNVLSFPAGDLEGLPGDVRRSLGDIVVCASVVAREAEAQGKAVAAHWGHMLVHGTLHLLGYDHQTESQAAEMEGLETRILASRNVTNPYRVRA